MMIARYPGIQYCVVAYCFSSPSSVAQTGLYRCWNSWSPTGDPNRLYRRWNTIPAKITTGRKNVFGIE